MKAFPPTNLINPYLPPREYCDYYVARYFEDIHCTYWLFPVDQFYARLDKAYKEKTAPSCSWLCCMYSIFALVADLPRDRPQVDNNTEEAEDSKSSLEYLTLARDLCCSMICHEADVDTIRGLAILTMALQSSGLKLVAWLHLGACVQIAKSLGLNRDDPLASQSFSPVDREQNRRIWWTLYFLDQSMASYSGSLFLIEDEQVPLPSDIVSGHLF